MKELGDKLIELTETQELTGSGWVFVRFKNLEVHMARFKPLKGSSYFPLPEKLKLKQAIVNVENIDKIEQIWVNLGIWCARITTIHNCYSTRFMTLLTLLYG